MGIEELQSGGADLLVDGVTVDTGGIDAGLGELVAALVVAFVDEDLVIDQAGDDDELGIWDVRGAKAAFSCAGVCMSRAPTVTWAGMVI